MEVTPERITITTGLLAILAGAKLKVWTWYHQIDELKASHERERKQWEAQLEQLREELRKAEAREKVMMEIAFERRDLVEKAVDVAIGSKAA